MLLVHYNMYFLIKRFIFKRLNMQLPQFRELAKSMLVSNFYIFSQKILVIRKLFSNVSEILKPSIAFIYFLIKRFIVKCF